MYSNILQQLKETGCGEEEEKLPDILKRFSNVSSHSTCIGYNT